MYQQHQLYRKHSRSHQFLKANSREIGSGSLSTQVGEITHLNHTWFVRPVDSNRQPSPILSAWFTEILSAIFENRSQPQTVYELLADNLDLVQYLPNQLQRLQTSVATLTKEQRFTLAWVLVDLGGWIWKLLDGDKAQNREVAIACCETALHLLEFHKFSRIWGKIHHNLALAYAERLMGDRTSNLSQAFTHYQQSAQVVGRQSFPNQWLAINN